MKKAILVSTFFCSVFGVQKMTAQNVMVTEHFRIGEGIEVKLSELEIMRLLNLKGVRMVDFDGYQGLTVVYDLAKNDFSEVRDRVKAVFTTSLDASSVQNMARENSNATRRTR